MLDALGFFLLVEVVGLAAVPLAGLAFERLPGGGLGFAKPLGLLLVTWVVWMLASVTPVSYGATTILVVGALLAFAGALTAARQRTLAAGPLRAAARDDPVRVRLWLGSEIVFAVAFAAAALLVAYSPDVWGTEKPMDMAFMNASNASTSFPPHDPWMAGEELNYYYFGHLAAAIVIKVVGTAPDVGYNLALALVMALSATAVFTLAGTLWAAARPQLAGVRGGPVAVGATAVVVCIVLGNLAGVREWLDAADPPGDYDWFAPSRVVPGTINEFPWFSFLLGDLHAHVLALPFTFLAMAFALQIVLAGPRGDAVLRGVAEALAAGLAVGVLYAVNSWSYPLTAGLLAAAVMVWLRDARSAGRRGYAITWLVLALGASVVLVLPFWLNFNPAAEGIALVEERRPFARFLGDFALLYGIFAGLLAAAFVARARAARRFIRTLAWGGVAAIFAGSLLATADLAGVLVLALLLAVAAGAALSRALDASERFLWLLVSGGLACVIVPDLVYVRDAFDGSDLYRMNTVFKLGYQAWLLLAVAAACALPWASVHMPRRAWTVWATAAAVLLLLGLVYPYAGTYARKDGFARSPSLDGLEWLRASAPGDPPAIDWLRANTPGDAIVLEAVGDDYSAFGHGRISTFTGRATVLGWPGHELQWDHEPGNRADDVRSLYTTDDLAQARELISRYGIDYVVHGPIERTTYGDAGLAKWDELGERVFDRDDTTIWQLD